MKKILVITCMLLTILMRFPVVDANEKVKVYIFTKEKEKICENAIKYFKQLQQEYRDYFEYQVYEVWDSSWKENSFNRDLLDEVTKHFKDEVLGAPYIVIGDNYSFDEYSEEYHEEYKDAIKKEYENENYKDIVADAIIQIEKQKAKEQVYTIILLVGILASISLLIFLARKNTQKNED